MATKKKRTQSATKPKRKSKRSPLAAPVIDQGQYHGRLFELGDMRLHWPPHPIAQLFPPMTEMERRDLKKDMVDRLNRGLDALEHALLIYKKMILVLQR